MPRTLSEQEFNALREEVLRNAPPNLTEAEFTRYAGPAMEQALGVAENTTAPLQGSSMRRALSGIWENVNPVTMAKGLWGVLPVPQALGGSGVLEGPAHLATAVASGAVDQFQKARTAPTLSEKMGHGLASMIPLVGPAAANAAEYGAATGDVAGMVGQGVGMSLPFSALAAAKTGARAAGTVARQVPGVNRLAAAADRSAVSRLIEVAGPKVGPNKTRFNQKLAKVAPQILRDPELSAMSRQGLAGKVDTQLSEAGAALDAAADARSLAPLETGPLLESLRAKRGALTADPVVGSRMIPSYVESGGAGDGLSAASAGRGVSGRGAAGTPGGRSFRATDNPAELFNDVLADARASGYAGPTGELRAGFDAQLTAARELQTELTSLHQAHAPDALLRAIAKVGGIGDDAGFPGEIAQLWENSSGHVTGKGIVKGGSRVRQSRTLSSGGFAGVPGVLKKTGGLPLDTVAELLRQDPRFEHLAGPRELLQALEQARGSKARPPQLTEALEIVGVRPGASWWDNADDVSFDPDALESAVPSPPARVGRPIGQPVDPSPQAPRLEQIDRATDEIERLGPIAPYESLRKIRQAYDIPAEAIYSPSLTADYMKAQGGKRGAADVTGSLREFLAKADPTTAKANARYALLKTARDVLHATEETEAARPKVGRRIVARATGAMIGSQHGAPGAVIGVGVASLIERAAEFAPTLQIAIARRLAAVADALRKGDEAGATRIFERVERQFRPVRTTAKAATQMETGAGVLTTSEEDRAPRGAPSSQR